MLIEVDAGFIPFIHPPRDKKSCTLACHDGVLVPVMWHTIRRPTGSADTGHPRISALPCGRNRGSEGCMVCPLLPCNLASLTTWQPG